jgi:hypothetical protein
MEYKRVSTWGGLWVAQVVEHLPSMCEALSSNSSTEGKKSLHLKNES